jgi:hypothetical protein
VSSRTKFLLPLLALLALMALPAVSEAAPSFKWNAGVRIESATKGGLNTVSCPATTLCVAGDSNGDVLWTTTPTTTKDSWSSARVDTDRGQISGVSCPSITFCGAVDSDGAFVSSTTPTKGLKAWSRPVRIDSAASAGGGYAGLSSISCPSSTLCVAVDSAADSNVVYSTDPTGGKTAWHSVALAGQATSVDCPTTTLCVIGGSERWVSTDPSSAKSWVPSGAVSGEIYSDMDCFGANLCVGIGYGNTTPGFSAASKTPTKAWSATFQVETNPPPAGGGLLDAVGCTRGVCVSLDGADNAYVTGTPVTGVWSAGGAIRTKAASQWNAVSCTGGICVVVDSAGVETTGKLS